MKKIILFLSTIVFFLTGFSQTVFRTPVKKASLASDSTQPTLERQQVLSGYLAKAIKYKTNILILSTISKNTRWQDAVFLGKLESKKVFKVDMSSIVSKYISETEKNLSGLFERAASNNWILFFDEADALFGKSSGSSNLIDHIQAQVKEKDVRTIFCCGKDCLEALKKTSHIILE